ncbi:hypothetical protein SAMN05421812_103681 [Asanoa hainanensis]|uniref:DUF4383 domain-containing protein n=1 Tax=Asanoa hainanensis TaxID=560556 RepID=A0A239KQD3_9ACTN|nr:DUF4383 domain-containing protein [Asanoa hainanensis]SNT19833.1 hypothetical protein SAMN05421812_103681 [Asanoa hainanensis]
MHNPINHPARATYRVLAGLIGLYLVVFGGIGVATTSGDLFAQDAGRTLGQGSNLANALISLVVGAIVVIGAVVGRNVDVVVNRVFGWVLMALGLITLATLRTDANYLGHTLATSIVMMGVGQVLLLAAMYGKVGTADEHAAWQRARLEF